MRRWTIFNAVGICGFGVQLAVLSVLLDLHVHYLSATAAAIEAAILHNFFWHERWTWRDRALAPGRRVERLVRFHMLNGLVSLAGNLALMWLLVGQAGLSPIPANLASVAICAVVNFMASERLVFQT